MTDLLLRIGISNLCVSLVIAIVAWAVHAQGRRPRMAHLLWLLVLAKLVAPPIFTVPVVPVPAFGAGAADTPTGPTGLEAAPAGALEPGIAAPGSTASAWLADHAKTGLILLWALGSASVLAWSLLRIYRFNRLLAAASKVAAPELQRAAAEIARRLGLKSAPAITTTSARLSPMVWWIGGRVRVVIPEALIGRMDAGQLRWVLAHELAHIRRRDHLVRWLEWLACVGFWWNPVAWWARRNLRVNEEICCDALVLSRLEPRPRIYANALMTVIKYLASPAIRPPALASEFSSGGTTLERRFKMIVSKHRIARTPGWMAAGVLLVAVVLMPLGVAYAQDYKAIERRLGKAVGAGELSLEQASAMMDALRRVADRIGPEVIGDDAPPSRDRAAYERGRLEERRNAGRNRRGATETTFFAPLPPRTETTFRTETVIR